jgi:osmotically-inducible protein OsmY
MRICRLRYLGCVLSMALLLSACTPLILGGVVTGVSVLHDRRSAGTLVDDKTILLKALSVSQSDENGKKRSNISVDVYNQRVLLTGQAADRQAISQFVQQVKEISQVRQVLNEVQVAAESTWSDAASAAYLTGKVKLALLDIDLEGFDPTRVLITSSLGTVYVMGLLTPEEMAQVTAKVRFVSGVKRVVRLFERYTP